MTCTHIMLTTMQVLFNLYNNPGLSLGSHKSKIWDKYLSVIVHLKDDFRQTVRQRDERSHKAT